MTLSKAPLLAAVAALALAACSAAPETGVTPRQPAVAAPAAPGAPAGPEAEGIEFRGPEGTQWVKPGVTSESYRADIDDCYSYAQAQVAHDVRIESDSRAAFETSPSGLGLTELRGRMDQFERGNRRSILFSNCMVAKGYSRRLGQ